MSEPAGSPGRPWAAGGRPDPHRHQRRAQGHQQPAAADGDRDQWPPTVIAITICRCGCHQFLIS